MAKKALLIGINRYRVAGADLRGCVNDVDNMMEILREFYGFAQTNITSLTDFKATKKAMESGIKKLIASGRKGDVLLLHYSGHGSNVPDNNGDEADRRDEILCPTDLDWNDTLRDDWLRSQFDALRVGVPARRSAFRHAGVPARPPASLNSLWRAGRSAFRHAGVNLTVIMDCCHSGTVTRAIQPPDAASIPRFLPCPLDLIAVESGRRLAGTRNTSLRSTTRAPKKKRSDIVTADIPETLISGCRDTQSSADANINRTFNGALTYSLATTIREAKGRLTYRALHTESSKWLKKNGYDQVPQLEGMKESFEREFLSA